MTRRLLIRTGAAALATLAGAAGLPGTARAQQGAFPNRSIRIIVPFAAGTGSDVVARAVGQRVSEQTGQPVVVENRDGASGVVATTLVQKSPADGYTLLMAANPFTLAPGLFATPPYDPLKDFVPVAKVGDVPIVLCANVDSPFRTLKELIAYAKANPGKLSYASSGKGTPSQFEMELFKQAAGVNIVEVPYRNTAQALTDVIGGSLAMYPSALPLALPQLKAGKVRALAVIDRQRTPALPDVPTMAEGLEMPSYVATPLWYGFVAPAGVPRDVVGRLNAEIMKAVQTPAVRERLVGVGAQLVDIPNDEFAGLMKAEVEKAARLIRLLGIRND